MVVGGGGCGEGGGRERADVSEHSEMEGPSLHAAHRPNYKPYTCRHCHSILKGREGGREGRKEERKDGGREG